MQKSLDLPFGTERLAEAARQHALGRLMQKQGLVEAALDAYGLSLQLGGAEPGRLADMSFALCDAGMFEAAAGAARMALQLKPDCKTAHNNLGFSLLNLNRSAEALQAYDAAMRLDPGYAVARFGRSLAMLKMGDYRRGWTEFEWRWRHNGQRRTDLAMPSWSGASLKGRSILIHPEQGLGDIIQFVRFAPMLTARGARVVLEVPRGLVRLLQQIEGIAEVVETGGKPRTHLHCPIASLPGLLRIVPSALPKAPYLRLPSPSQASAALRAKATAGAKDALVVGLVWSGDPRPGQIAANLIDRRRSTSLDTFAPLFEVPGVRFLSFQLGTARKQIAETGLPITDAMDEVRDFADTAALLPATDLLISVDTSMVHLAGAMGFPVWMASRFDGCWRWEEQRNDTPWYPTMRIFRQSSLGNWAGLVSELKRALAERRSE